MIELMMMTKSKIIFMMQIKLSNINNDDNDDNNLHIDTLLTNLFFMVSTVLISLQKKQSFHENICTEHDLCNIKISKRNKNER